MVKPEPIIFVEVEINNRSLRGFGSLRSVGFSGQPDFNEDRGQDKPNLPRSHVIRTVIGVASLHCFNAGKYTILIYLGKDIFVLPKHRVRRCHPSVLYRQR
jgi:hypothetical protein